MDNKSSPSIMSTNASRAIASLYSSELYSDVELKLTINSCDGKKALESIFAHSLPLKLRSSFFSEQLPKPFSLSLQERYCLKLDVTQCAGGEETFRWVLKFLYTDTVEFDVASGGREVDELVNLLLASERYGVQVLTQHCLRHLKEDLLTGEKALSILCLLRQRRQQLLGVGGESCLDKAISICLYFIDEHASDIVDNSTFRSIDHALLCELLARDTFDVKEVILFIRVVKWATEECLRLQLDPTGPNLRFVLGEDALQLLRFPTMDYWEFAQAVATLGLLNDAEELDVYRAIANPNGNNRRDPKRPRKAYCSKPRQLLLEPRKVSNPAPTLADAISDLYRNGAAYADVIIRLANVDVANGNENRDTIPMGAIGQYDDTRVVYAHSLVLRLLSPFFNAALHSKAVHDPPIASNFGGHTESGVEQTSPMSVSSLVSLAMEQCQRQGLLKPAATIDVNVSSSGCDEGCVRLSTFTAIMEYLYTDDVTLDAKNFVDIFYAANYHLLESLERHCLKNITKILRPENVFCILSELHRRGNFSQILRDTCLLAADWLIRFADLAELQLPRDLLAQLLARPTLRISEQTLFLKVMKWARWECRNSGLEFNGLNLRHLLGPATNIRASLMDMDFFQNAVPHGLFTPQENSILISLIKATPVDHSIVIATRAYASEKEQLLEGYFVCGISNDYAKIAQETYMSHEAVVRWFKQRRSQHEKAESKVDCPCCHREKVESPQPLCPTCMRNIIQWVDNGWMDDRFGLGFRAPSLKTCVNCQEMVTAYAPICPMCKYRCLNRR